MSPARKCASNLCVAAHTTMDGDVGELSSAMAKMSTSTDAISDVKLLDFCVDKVNRLWFNLELGSDESDSPKNFEWLPEDVVRRQWPTLLLDFYVGHLRLSGHSAMNSDFVLDSDVEALANSRHLLAAGFRCLLSGRTPASILDLVRYRVDDQVLVLVRFEDDPQVNGLVHFEVCVKEFPELLLDFLREKFF